MAHIGWSHSCIERNSSLLESVECLRSTVWTQSLGRGESELFATLQPSQT